MSIKYENPQEIADWINQVYQKTPWFHPLTCICGEELQANYDADHAWLKCPNHRDISNTTYVQKIPDAIIELQKIYPKELPPPYISTHLK